MSREDMELLLAQLETRGVESRLVRRLLARHDRLFAACQRVLDYYDHGQLSDHRDVLRQLHQAIQTDDAGGEGGA